MKNQGVQTVARWARQAATISVLIGTLQWCCCLALYATASKPVPCSAPAYRQFDFWLGEWDVFEEGGSKPRSPGKHNQHPKRLWPARTV